MKRIEICSYGPLPQCVRFAEGDLPAVGDHDILVKVVAVSVNPIDYKIANGDLRRVLRLNLPAPFGFDCCGRVEVLGSKVIGYEVGDLVYARAPRERMGAFAEFVAIESRYVAKAPTSLSAQAAASLPLVALTTVQALVDRAKARKGQSILIHAGSGGLGSFAIQYAKQELGLNVTTTTSSRNAHWVRELGADVVVAYDRENYASLPARYDIVFDTLGGPTTSASFCVLKQGGTVVSVMGPPDRAFARQVGANLALSLVMWCIVFRCNCAPDELVVTTSASSQSPAEYSWNTLVAWSMLERYEPWSKESIHSIRPSKLCSTRRRVVQGGNSSFRYRHERQEDDVRSNAQPCLRRN
jgi:alcohol dehydrogenase